MRRVGIGVALAGLVSALLAVVAPSPARAADCGAWVDTGFHVSQQACLYWDGQYGEIVGYTLFRIDPGFNGGHVNQCWVHLRLTSGYGSVNNADAYDCSRIARSGPSNVNHYRGWGFGPGNPNGGTYWLDACITVVTGVAYTTCWTSRRALSPYIFL